LNSAVNRLRVCFCLLIVFSQRKTRFPP
jgi:hypothetical protein